MIERKYLAHYLDSSFGGESVAYVRLGKDLEEYNEELNPDVTVSKNILGEQSVKHSGYEAQADVDPFYYENYDDSLSNKIMELANTRATGDKCNFKTGRNRGCRTYSCMGISGRCVCNSE